MKRRVVAVLLARMGASRLPGKMLMPVAGRPLVERCVERLKRAARVDELVLATTTNPKDDQLAEWAARYPLNCFRGSEEDVLGRFYQAAKNSSAEIAVRVTGDNPLVDGLLVDRVAGEFLQGSEDYVGAVPGKEWGLPAGLAVEAVSFQALEKSWREGVDPASREHVTLYIRQHPETFRVRYLSFPDCSELRLAVDTAEDLTLVRRIFEHFRGAVFSWTDGVQAVRDHPEWIQINRHVRQREV